jgi:hypothetical protein
MDILDNNVLVNLFVSTQKNNLDLCIEKGVKLVLLLLLLFEKVFTLKNPQVNHDQW